MPDFDINNLKIHLQSLADGIAADPRAVAELLGSFPEACRLIRESLNQTAGSAVETAALSTTSLDGKVDDGVPIGLQSFSPGEFFAWFDSKIDLLSRQTMISATRTWLSGSIIGKDYGHDENKKIVSATQRALNLLSLRIKCPGGAISGPCGKAAQLRFKEKVKGYSQGAFFFQHAEAGRGTHRASKVFPALELMDAPKDKRYTNLQ